MKVVIGHIRMVLLLVAACTAYFIAMKISVGNVTPLGSGGPGIFPLPLWLSIPTVILLLMYGSIALFQAAFHNKVYWYIPLCFLMFSCIELIVRWMPGSFSDNSLWPDLGSVLLFVLVSGYFICLSFYGRLVAKNIKLARGDMWYFVIAVICFVGCLFLDLNSELAWMYRPSNLIGLGVTASFLYIIL